MSHPIVRRLPFSFDADVPFQWQPQNPAFGIFGNLFTFMAVPFERYIVSTVRKAKEVIDDLEVAEEADVFLKQEAQHANAHRKHMQSLVGQYPGLEECYEYACHSYDDLIKSAPLSFNLAYIANLEATFTPLFKVILDHRASLFRGADPTVTALLTWHFVEEIEHRSSGLIVCNSVVGNRWYRTRHIRGTFDHVNNLAARVAASFDKHVPESDRLVSAQRILGSRRAVFGDRFPRWNRRLKEQGPYPPLFEDVRTADLIAMIGRLALSQLPLHDPSRQPLPVWAGTWIEEYERGTDMISYAGRVAEI